MPVKKLVITGLIVTRNYKSCGGDRKRCDREGHAVFLHPRVDSAIMGFVSMGISTSSTNLIVLYLYNSSEYCAFSLFTVAQNVSTIPS